MQADYKQLTTFSTNNNNPNQQKFLCHEYNTSTMNFSYLQLRTGEVVGQPGGRRAAGQASGRRRRCPNLAEKTEGCPGSSKQRATPHGRSCRGWGPRACGGGDGRSRGRGPATSEMASEVGALLGIDTAGVGGLQDRCRRR